MCHVLDVNEECNAIKSIDSTKLVSPGEGREEKGSPSFAAVCQALRETSLDGRKREFRKDVSEKNDLII